MNLNYIKVDLHLRIQSRGELKFLRKTEVNDLCTLTKGPRRKKVINIPNMLLKLSYVRDATYAVLNRQLNCSFRE